MRRAAFVLLGILLVIGESALAQALCPLDHYIQISPRGRDAIGGIAGDGINFLAVYRDDSNFAANGYDIYGARVAADGTVLDPNGIPIAVGPNYDTNPGNQYIPSVAFDGTNYMVVWTENRQPSPVVDYEIFGARVTPNGQVLDPGGFQITSGADPLRMPSIAFDGMNFLIVWRTGGSNIYGIRVSKTGAPLDNRVGVAISTFPGFYPYVAFDGANYLVAWHDQRNAATGLDIYATRVSKAFTILDPGGFPISRDPGDQDHVTISFNGSNYLVTWFSHVGSFTGFPGSAHAARVSTAGVVLDVPGMVIAESARTHVAATSNGMHHFVVWMVDHFLTDFRQTDVYGRRVTTDGVMDDRPTTIGSRYWHQFGPVVGYTNGRYLVAWGELGSRGCVSGCLWGQIVASQGAAPTPPLTPAAPTQAGWSAAPSPGNLALFAVAAAPNEVYVAGEGGRPFELDGAVWRGRMEGSAPHAYDLWIAASRDYWVHGGCFSVWRLRAGGSDGTSCTVQPNCCQSPDSSGFGAGIWGTSSSEVFAVGTDGFAARWNGAAWTRLATATTLDLRGVWGSSGTNVYAVGEFGTVIRWNGASWSRVPGIPLCQSFSDIWGSSASDIWVVGDFGSVLHYDGTAWTAFESGTREHLMSIAGFNRQHVYAVGLNGTIIRFDGSQWSREASGTMAALHDVAAAGRDVWAVGNGGTVLTKTVPLIGNANGDGAVDVADIFYLINFIFAGGAVPVQNGDANRDGQVGTADIFFLINYLFAGGPPPV